MHVVLRFFIVFCLFGSWAMGQSVPRDFFYSDYNPTTGTATFVNSVLGWDLFFNSGFKGQSTVIGNLEGGTIWSGHEVFARPTTEANSFHTYVNPAAGSVNEMDYHATMVGHVLAGSGYQSVNGGVYTYLGLGMAPEATVISGGIATGFSSSSPGSFSTTTSSVVTAYRAFFQGVGLGTGVARPDVINSSWGGGDSAATEPEYLAMDGLARQNASVAFVASAGNSGIDPVAAPASGFNNISVGSLGGASFLQPSSFSSRGLADFHLPGANGGTTLTGVRVAVDLAAPGENLVLAAYIGDTGTLGVDPAWVNDVQTPSPTDLYFTSADGTSFSSPIVAGGVALLKDGAKTILSTNLTNALDTRVVKSVLMAGSKMTEGWDNKQNAMNVTTQALDARTGAGAMDLEGAATVYYSGTRDVAGSLGGAIQKDGWDSATIHLGSTTEYKFSSTFTEEMSIAIALNWFADRGFDDATETGSEIAFANLDLQLWSLDENGNFVTMVGGSMSTYNNTEVLRIASLAAGNYGLRVVFDDMVYDSTNAVTDEAYGLAWRAEVIPEPSAEILLAGASCMLCFGRRRKF
jgi:hypothetical protein